jgi:hypothetical protein
VNQERKFKLILTGSVILCFLINIFLKNNIWVAVSNAIIFGLSVLILKRFNPFFLPVLALAPIFNFDIKQIQINFLLIAFLGLIFLAKKIKTGKNLVILIALGLFVWGNLLGAKIINWPNSFDISQPITGIEPIKDYMNQHQKDTVFLPYKVRLLIYNPLIYIYYGLGNMFHLITLGNLASVILWVNIYPLIIGIWEKIKEKKKIWFWIFLTTGLAIIAIDKSNDKFNSLYFLSPILVYLTAKGLEKINVKIYAVLLGVTILFGLVR